MLGADNQQPSAEELCWLAGFINADGSFAVYRKDKGLFCRFQITNHDKEIVVYARNILQKIIARQISLVQVKHVSKYKDKLFVWRVSTERRNELKIICEVLIPYLRGERKERAKIINIFLDQHKYYSKINSDDVELLDKIKKMTTKGILSKSLYEEFFGKGSETKDQHTISV